MLGGGDYSNFMNELKKKKKNREQRRFSDEQIRCLELMFESDRKLEPKQKVELARELGLQPRQVAIWFQNKRARWKSKKIEKEFDILRADFDHLASQHDALKKENLVLAAELQKLNQLLQKPGDEGRRCTGIPAMSSTDPESNKGRSIPEMKPRNCEIGQAISEDETLKTEYLKFGEEPELMNIVEPADSSLTSSDNWGAFESDPLLDQSCRGFPWWDFWS